LGANGCTDMDSAFGRIPVEVGSWGFLCGAVVAGLLSLAAARGWSVGRWSRLGVPLLGVLAAVLLVLVPDSQLLVMLAYAPIFLVGSPFGWPPGSYFDEVTWTVVFQLLSVGAGYCWLQPRWHGDVGHRTPAGPVVVRRAVHAGPHRTPQRPGDVG